MSPVRPSADGEAILESQKRRAGPEKPGARKWKLNRNWLLSWLISTLLGLALTMPLIAQVADAGVELAFMPATINVTLLNEGGKYVAVDLKHIPEGGQCRMDKDATIVRVGPGTAPGTTRVRYAAAQLSTGGCPFMTTFDLPDADYAKGRAAFVEMKDDAWKKVDEIKKDLGDKWPASQM